MRSLIVFIIWIIGFFIICFLPLAASIYFDNGWLLFTYLVSWIPGSMLMGIAQALV